MLFPVPTECNDRLFCSDQRKYRSHLSQTRAVFEIARRKNWVKTHDEAGRELNIFHPDQIKHYPENTQTLICIQTELSRLKGVNVNNSLVFYITCAQIAQFGKYAFWPKHFTLNLQFFNVRKCKPVKSVIISLLYHDISISLHALILDILQLSPMPWSTQVNIYHLPSYHCNNLKKKKYIMH